MMSPAQRISLQEPDMTSALAPLMHYENAALRNLIDNDTAVEEYVKNLDQCRTLARHKDLKMTENKSLAEYNLQLEPAFESGKNNLKELCSQIEILCQSVQGKERLRSGSGSITAETALALLQTSAAETEEETEKVAESFYQKDLDVDEFLDKFQEKRKVMHLRKVKAEKMVDLVSKSNQRNSGPPRRAAPLPPYPVGPNSFFNHF